MREVVRFTGELKRATVRREADRSFASVKVETDDIKPIAQSMDSVGVELGVSTAGMKGSAGRLIAA